MNDLVKVKSPNSDDFLRIEFMVSNVCNYKCDYCGPWANGGDYKNPKDVDLLVKNVSHFLEYYYKNGKKKIEINLQGGEPTLWPHLRTFIQRIREHFDVYFYITTNGSRTERWWNENVELFDKVKFSYHPEYADDDHFIRVIDIAYSKGVQTHALIMMDPAKWEISMEMIEKCKNQSKYPWFVSAMMLNNYIPYTEEQMKIFETPLKRPTINELRQIYSESDLEPKIKVVYENGAENRVSLNWLEVNNKNHFQGWVCTLALENVNVKADGTITGVCGVVPFGEESYYNIYDPNFVDNFNPEFKPVICPKKSCFCQPEYNMTKWKPFS